MACPGNWPDPGIRLANRAGRPQPSGLTSLRSNWNSSYRFVDYATQGYLLLVVVVIAVFHGPALPGWPWLLAAHLLAVALAHGIIVAGSRAGAPAPVRFLRGFYPIPFYLGFYRETEFINALVGTPRLDPPLIRADHALFGSQPSVELMAAVPNPFLSELLYAAYFSYYIMIVGLGAWLLWRHRPAFQHFVAVVSFAFYVCFAIYLFVPVVGPRLFFLDTPERDLFLHLYGTPPPPVPEAVQGWPFYGIMQFIYRNFEAHSAAFPSSHTAVSLVTTYFTWRYLPRLRWTHCTATTLLIISTVYLRYHYVVDVVAGIILAAILLPLGNLLYRKFDGPSDRSGEE